MANETALITAQDRQRLARCLESLLEQPDARDLDYVRRLAKALDDADVALDPGEVPPDMITMRSKVRLRNVDTNTEMTVTLVYPSESVPAENRISVTAPVGAAILGHRLGDVVSLKVPKGESRLRIEEIVYQPEASGDYHL